MRGLFADHAGVVCDLDGVVYRGARAVQHAVPSLTAVDVPVLYATNNASRPPEAVSEHLVALGLTTDPGAVVTSSQAAAWVLGDALDPGSLVLALGGPGVAQAVAAAGFTVRGPEEDGRAAAVVQGYGPDVRAADLARAAYAVRSGARWIATNTDLTLPTEHGLAPGNGALVHAVALAVGREPDEVAGKPHPPIYELSAERLGAAGATLLAVGDRLDTDIAGANGVGMDSVLVLTGVDGIESIAAAPAALRPTWMARDLRVLVDEAEQDVALTLTEGMRRIWEDVDAQAPPRELAERIDELVRCHESGAGG